MNIDKNDFFREATLRIYSNLEIENAMVSFLQYIQDFIPVERLILQYYDKNEKVMQTIADATPEKGESFDRTTPLSEEAKAVIRKKYAEGIPEPYIYEKPREIPVAREILERIKQNAESILILPLGIHEMFVGVVTFISTDSQYNEKHLKLASILKEPFQIAMSNAIKYRTELKFFNRDFFFEVTKRICGNLEIEKGLFKYFQYISKYIPIDALYLERYEKKLRRTQ
jgi:transcriptional regulator with GAF, ATPase, and Fis domain